MNMNKKERLITTRRLDPLCVRAIEDQRKSIEKEIDKRESKSFGTRMSQPTSFIFASKILGYKYFKKHFGRLPIEEVERLKRNRRR